MILDLDQFIRREKPFWDELEAAAKRDAAGSGVSSIADARRFHYLYERAASDLARVRTFAAEPELRGYLENLVSQAYARLHRRRDSGMRFRPVRWLLQTFPQAFRRHIVAFWVSLGISILSAVLGAFLTGVDPDNRMLMVPAGFSHLNQSPSERVAKEEKNAAQNAGRVGAHAAEFSGMLMNNNIRVALRALAFGMSAGVLTVLVLIKNGIMLGFVIYDYVADGQSTFLVAWLLPHGVPELTAIFIGGQGGLVLARAVIGWGQPLRLRQRLRAVRDDLATIAGGLAVMLVWAGFIEAFLSQYHGPALYPWKIGFGLVELGLLITYLGIFGRRKPNTANA